MLTTAVGRQMTIQKINGGQPYKNRKNKYIQEEESGKQTGETTKKAKKTQFVDFIC